MKRILATTALTASLCMPAFAQDATATDPATTPEASTKMAAGGFIQTADPQDVLASDFIGKRVYAMSEEMEYAQEGIADVDAGWEDIGEVSDVILARTGEVEGVIVDVGGFLGIGEKPVALPMDSLKLVADADAPGQYFVTVASSREALDQAPSFEYTDATPMDQAAATDGSVAMPLEETPGDEVDMAADNDVTADPMASDPNSSEEMAEMAEAGDNAADEAEAEVTEELAEGEAALEEAGDEMAQEMAEAGDALEEAGNEAAQEMAEAGDAVEQTAEEAMEPETEMAEADADADAMESFTRDGYSPVMVTELSSEDLTGLAVYDSNDNRVGEISEVLISSDGVVTDAVIDVGGFLGIGEKPVAISFKGISLQKQADGDDLRAYVNTTEEQLKSFPAYEDG